MKNLKMIPLALILVFAIVACEKEELNAFQNGDIETPSAIIQNDENTTKDKFKNNKAGPWAKKIMELDPNGELTGCPNDGSSCEVVVVTSGVIGNFFDINDDYIEDSFSNNYALALSYFPKDGVDNVISGVFYVELYTNPSTSAEFVRFYNSITNVNEVTAALQ